MTDWRERWGILGWLLREGPHIVNSDANPRRICKENKSTSIHITDDCYIWAPGPHNYETKQQLVNWQTSERTNKLRNSIAWVFQAFRFYCSGPRSKKLPVDAGFWAGLPYWPEFLCDSFCFVFPFHPVSTQYDTTFPTVAAMVSVLHSFQ